MKLLNCINISKEFGHRRVLDAVGFDIVENRRYGLIGANGSGKTTLLNILLGRLSADSGQVSIEPDCRIGFVPQNPGFTPGFTAVEALLEDLQPLAAALRGAEDDLAADPGEAGGVGGSSAPDATGGILQRRLNAYQRARDAWDAAGGDEASSRAEKLMEQAGIADRSDTAVEKLSGGEQNILALIRALLSDPNLLILDEPGNHLDYRGLAWLESFLTSFRGAVLVVSHNRYLLDRVATDILELKDGKIRPFSGNYSAFRVHSLQNAAAGQAAWKANRKTLHRIEEMVRRFAVIAASRPDPAWGKRLRAARSRLAQEKDRAVERPDLEGAAIQPEFASGNVQGDIAVRISGYSCSRGGKELFNNADLELERGMRAALIGPNGSGKTTLLGELAEQGSWDHGSLRIVDSLNVGYIRQYADFEDPRRTLEDEVLSWGALSRDRALALLLPMNFRYEDLTKPLSALSGGEVNRLQIARIMYEKPDVIFMDEPTNHLDIPSREALENALDEFQGTVLTVSHDRYFLDRVADHIVELRDGKLELFAGSFSEYFHHRGENRLSSGRLRDRSRERRRDAAGNGPRSGSPGGDDAAGLERRIEELEDKKLRLETDLRAALEAGDHQRGRQLGIRLEKEQKLLTDLYARWEKLL